MNKFFRIINLKITCRSKFIPYNIMCIDGNEDPNFTPYGLLIRSNVTDPTTSLSRICEMRTTCMFSLQYTKLIRPFNTEMRWIVHQKGSEAWIIGILLRIFFFLWFTPKCAPFLFLVFIKKILTVRQIVPSNLEFWRSREGGVATERRGSDAPFARGDILLLSEIHSFLKLW